ncbi:MAG: hypothetical protein JOZ41_01820, partial [Chloroflexi bacterium]|nr:hypothetical protein [Chloroflexota bacterium]
PLAIVVLKEEHAAGTTEGHLKEHVKSYAERGIISKFAIPDRIVFVDAIDKTSVGKMDKKALRQKFGQPAERVPSTETPATAGGN